MWDVEYTDGFAEWWESLTEPEQESVACDVEILRTVGPVLGRPHVDTIHGSRFSNMKELRTQHQGRPYRTLFAIDPRRTAILLIGGNKTGDARWYERMVPIADEMYEEHIFALQRGRLI